MTNRERNDNLMAMTDEELFAALREQVNLSRNSQCGHNRKLTRAIGKEMVRRGWKRTSPPPTAAERT